MQILVKITAVMSFILLNACSASYEKLQNSSFNPPDELSQHLLYFYKEKADFEAKKMHDWNSAKLYSEKAIQAALGKKILPQKINYWKISIEDQYQITKGFENLMTVYEEAVLLDPYNLAKAISSLDCWSEQQEEKWQHWDIANCKEDFLQAMHSIYNLLEKSKKKQKVVKKIKTENETNAASIVTQDKKREVLQIVYFDFDKSNLSTVSKNEMRKFINENKNKINRYLVIGHTDTMGTNAYNDYLSLDRAKTIKKLLINLGIKSQNIKIFGKGEKDLKVKTKDETPHPVNRRAEISPLN